MINGVQPFWQQVAVGAVLIVAVYVDQARRAAAARGGRPHRSPLRPWGKKHSSNHDQGGST